MRIVIIGGVSNRNDIIKGGVESVVSNLVSGFEHFTEHQITLLGKCIEPVKNGNISFQKIPLIFPKLGLNLNFFLFRNRIIRQIEKIYKPDIYHFQGTVPNLFLINNKIQNKTVVTQHGILQEEIKYQVSRIKKFKFRIKIFFETHYITKIRNIIFISEYNKKYMLSNSPFLNKAKFELIYNPVNPVFLKQITTLPKNNRLYFTGEIKKRKGLHDLLIAIKQLSKKGINYTLDVIGGFKEKKYENEINNIVRNNEYLKQNVIFHGWKLPHEIIEIASKCCFFVLPSYQETLPVSVAEAMSLGKVVIATNLPGIKEMIVDGEEGKLFTKGNLPELINILEDFSDNSSALADYSYRAKQKAELMFSATRIADRTISFYKRILNEQ